MAGLLRKTRSRKVFRDGKVYVCARMCDTCIFRPGNLMNLEEDRVEQMVAQATRAESCIPCHQTLSGKQAVCRGFFERHAPSTVSEGIQKTRAHANHIRPCA